EVAVRRGLDARALGGRVPAQHGVGPQVASPSARVLETTYLWMLFIRWPKASWSMSGQAAAKPWEVVRPSSSDSASNSSSYLNWSPSLARSKSKVHRGSSMTPSSDTNSVTTILLIAFLPLSDAGSSSTRAGRAVIDISQVSFSCSPRPAGGHDDVDRPIRRGQRRAEGCLGTGGGLVRRAGLRQDVHRRDHRAGHDGVHGGRNGGRRAVLRGDRAD